MFEKLLYDNNFIHMRQIEVFGVTPQHLWIGIIFVLMALVFMIMLMFVLWCIRKKAYIFLSYLISSLCLFVLLLCISTIFYVNDLPVDIIKMWKITLLSAGLFGFLISLFNCFKLLQYTYKK